MSVHNIIRRFHMIKQSKFLIRQSYGDTIFMEAIPGLFNTRQTTLTHSLCCVVFD